MIKSTVPTFLTLFKKRIYVALAICFVLVGFFYNPQIILPIDGSYYKITYAFVGLSIAIVYLILASIDWKLERNGIDIPDTTRMIHVSVLTSLIIIGFLMLYQYNLVVIKERGFLEPYDEMPSGIEEMDKLQFIAALIVLSLIIFIIGIFQGIRAKVKSSAEFE